MKSNGYYIPTKRKIPENFNEKDKTIVLTRKVLSYLNCDLKNIKVIYSNDINYDIHSFINEINSLSVATCNIVVDGFEDYLENSQVSADSKKQLLTGLDKAMRIQGVTLNVYSQELMAS